MKEIVLIAAIARRAAIGAAGQLAFHISADLKHFKALTSGHTVVMGRKTFESLPGGALPNRRNLVISRNSAYQAEGAEVFPSIEEAMATVPDGSVFIIGGGEIYRQTIPEADRLEITHIDADKDSADTFFPEINPEIWQATEISEPQTDPKTGLTYHFATYRRRNAQPETV